MTNKYGKAEFVTQESIFFFFSKLKSHSVLESLVYIVKIQCFAGPRRRGKVQGTRSDRACGLLE